MKKPILGAFILASGIALGEAHAHIKPTMWGYVWALEPQPDTELGGIPMQLVRCPNDDLTFPPWHVRVLYNEQAPFGSFFQERGR